MLNMCENRRAGNFKQILLCAITLYSLQRFPVPLVSTGICIYIYIYIYVNILEERPPLGEKFLENSCWMPFVFCQGFE